jgi:hypothetical protein
VSTINETLAPFTEQSDINWADVEAALQGREDTIRDDLSLIAARMGTFPEFVAEAFAEVGLGTPPDTEVREMLRRQFVQRMEWLQEQYRQQGIEPPPDPNA